MELSVRRLFLPGGTRSAGPYELRLPIFLQPLGGALKNRSAAPASPPCFRRRRWSAPLLFESTLESETSVFYKTKSPAYFCTLSIFGGRGWITQAAHLKRPRRGLFAAGTYSGGRCCSNPPAYVSLTFVQKKTASVSLHQRFFHGRGWIRTTEAEKQQIYSLSPLATREHAHILFVSVAGRLA